MHTCHTCRLRHEQRKPAVARAAHRLKPLSVPCSHYGRSVSAPAAECAQTLLRLFEGCAGRGVGRGGVEGKQAAEAQALWCWCELNAAGGRCDLGVARAHVPDRLLQKYTGGRRAEHTRVRLAVAPAPRTQKEQQAAAQAAACVRCRVARQQRPRARGVGQRTNRRG
jgi:hypothetical protein